LRLFTLKDEQEFIFCSYHLHLYILLLHQINTKDIYAKIFAKQVQVCHTDRMRHFGSQRDSYEYCFILRNAVIYSKDRSEIRISLNEEKHTYLLRIQDNTCRIPAKGLPFVFERFYRADKARSFKEGGTGLGLAIVKMILDIHHYDIDIQSKVDQGTTVIIKILK